MCSPPSSLLEFWEGTINGDLINNGKPFSLEIKSLLLRGSTLKNTEFIAGLAVYCGR
jgi:hypothetical protein